MKSVHLLLIVLVLGASCKRIVEVEDPVPQEVVFCAVEDAFLGDWRTDSVWVVTEVDTLDSLIENKQPGIFYDLTVDCGSQKQLLLSYTGFHNITTVDVRSSNFETSGGRVLTYDPFDEEQAPSNAGFEMPYEFINDTLMNCTIRQELGNNQRSTYYLFFQAI